MAKNPETPMDENIMDEEMDISIDMSQAKTFEPLPPDRPYLVALSAWKPGRSSNGNKKLHYEFTVVEPSEFANRKLIEDLSLENEYTLGRLQQILLALGFPEETVKANNFKLPKEDEVMGMQCMVRTRIQPSEQYGDRSRIRQLRPATAYKEATTF